MIAIAEVMSEYGVSAIAIERFVKTSSDNVDQLLRDLNITIEIDPAYNELIESLIAGAPQKRKRKR